MNTQLVRSSTNKVVGGVAGGIAEAYGWDPTLVRVGFVVLTLTHGIGLLLYLALWLIMPAGEVAMAQPSAGAVHPAMYTAQSGNRNRTIAYALLAVGALLLASALHITGPVLALLLIGGGWFLLRRH